jgi:hypothetical protein
MADGGFRMSDVGGPHLTNQHVSVPSVVQIRVRGISRGGAAPELQRGERNLPGYIGQHGQCFAATFLAMRLGLVVVTALGEFLQHAWQGGEMGGGRSSFRP